MVCAIVRCMNGPSVNILTWASKSARMAVAVLLCVSLFSSGLMAAPDCGARCCCGIHSQVRVLHSMPMMVPTPKGCCGGNEPRPCDIQGTQTYELPEVLYTGSYHSTRNGLGALLGQAPADMSKYTSDGTDKLIAINQNFRSPPLYLQHLAILA